MTDELRPNETEKELLTLAYNRFYDIYGEVFVDDFWEADATYRFTKIRDAFLVYAELLQYPPIARVLQHLRKSRPPMEAEIGEEFFKFVRNTLIHFPFFTQWDDVWITKDIVNWDKAGQSIDRFLSAYDGHEPVKYRFWQPDKQRMTYLSVCFPDGYARGEKVYLRDMLSEREGVQFSLILMRKIMDTQVEE